SRLAHRSRSWQGSSRSTGTGLMATAQIIDGRARAASIRSDVTERASALRNRSIRPKCLAIVAEGDAAGLLYAQTARRGGAEAGVDVEIVPIGAGADTSG